MRVAVTGAGGYLGFNLVRRLLADGHEVVGIDRLDPAETDRQWRRVTEDDGTSPVTWVRGDVLDEESMVRLLDGVEVVHHLVAVISLRQEDPLAWRVNTSGVATVARAALRAGVRRLVNCGSLASFHYRHGDTVHENSSRATDRSLPVYHRSKYAGELELLRVIDEGLDALTCNPTGIFGPLDLPDRLSRMNQTLLDAAAGRMPVGVTGSFDMVDVRDVADGFVRAAEHGRTGHNYLLGGHRYPMAGSQRLAAELVGRSGPRALLPVGLLERVSPLIDPVARRFGSESFAPAALENITMSPVVDRSKAVAELGYDPRPTEESIRDLVGFFLEHGLLRQSAVRA